MRSRDMNLLPHTTKLIASIAEKDWIIMYICQ